MDREIAQGSVQNLLAGAYIDFAITVVLAVFFLTVTGMFRLLQIVFSIHQLFLHRIIIWMVLFVARRPYFQVFDDFFPVT